MRFVVVLAQIGYCRKGTFKKYIQEKSKPLCNTYLTLLSQIVYCMELIFMFNKGYLLKYTRKGTNMLDNTGIGKTVVYNK